MYPGYEQYWLAVLENPEGVLPFINRPPSEGEVEYARFADETPHVVISQTLEAVAWERTQDRPRRGGHSDVEAAAGQAHLCGRRVRRSSRR